MSMKSLQIKPPDSMLQGIGRREINQTSPDWESMNIVIGMCVRKNTTMSKSNGRESRDVVAICRVGLGQTLVPESTKAQGS